jgi:hypothetical protein
MRRTNGIRSRALLLAVAGGLGFWIANFLISLTPLAAQYRAALSIPYLQMLLASLLGGLLIGFCVGSFLLRFFDRIPTRNPILKSLLLSLAVLIIVTVLTAGPARLFTSTGDAMHYFLVGVAFNALRILALGAVVGHLAGRLVGSTRGWKAGQDSGACLQGCVRRGK